MTQAGSGKAAVTPGIAFREGFVEADGFRIRYLEAGQGTPLICLHGGVGLQLTPAHELLTANRRVIAFEMPGFGESPENSSTESLTELAATMAAAIDALGIDRFDLIGASLGGNAALYLALQAPERVTALVLVAPAAIRPEGWQLLAGSPEEMARRDYAHPERVGPALQRDPTTVAKHMRLASRLLGPNRDPELESRLAGVATPTLVLFGTLDGVIPPEMGHFYKDLMPNCHLVFVYDAAHEIAVDRPEAFAEVVIDFLERREAFVISRRDQAILP